MEYLFIILILISLIVYVFLLFNRQIINRKCLVKKRKLIEKYKKNSYGYFTRPNLDITHILDNFNKALSKNFKVDTPLRNYTYSKNNLEPEIKNYNTKIIGKILNKINNNYKTRYKLLDIESINRKIDIIDNEELTIVFLIHEIDKFSTRKLVLNYFKDDKNNINYNWIKSLLSLKSNLQNLNLDNYDKSTVKTHEKIDNLDDIPYSYNSTILDKDMEKLKNLGIAQEPCKYDLDIWDKNGINKQFRLKKHCNVINHSNRILSKQPYVNPTIFKLN